MTLSLKSFEYPMLLLFYIFEYLAIVDEFYLEEGQQENQKQVHDLMQVQDIQKGLQQSVRAVKS